MVAFMEPERIGDIVGLTCMGNEGAQWIGMAPFVERNHLVQNLGDGTFFHSGSLAIRAAIAAGSRHHLQAALQRHGGDDRRAGRRGADVGARRRHDAAAEGVSQVIVTSDDPDRHRGLDRSPQASTVWDRSRLDEAQRVLADMKGMTVLIHDQACAAENRRGRSRGTIPTPGFRVVINERICEGCGDCGDKSNCLSVQPIDTPYGRKTRIHQTSCNFDFSCMQGDCPAFATVTVDPEPNRPPPSDPAHRPRRSARAGDSVWSTPTTSRFG